jgi:ATP-dependent RNA helicase DeaD
VESFEDLGVSPALVEALAAEGAERPTPLQQGGIPVIRRGNNVVAHAGPGAGTLVTYGAALLDRLEPGGGRPRGLVLVPAADTARRLAESLARLAQSTGHQVASLGAPWVLPERADVLFATPADLLIAARADVVDLGDVQALVLDAASLIQQTGGLQEVELLLEYLPRDGQRVVVSLPVSPEVSDFVGRHVKRAVHVPPQAVEPDDASPRRGEVRFRIVDEPKEEAALALAAELLQGSEVRHMVLFCRSEDVAADVGDFLTLHGYDAGPAGEASVPVWLAVDEIATLHALEAAEDVAVVSYDVPPGPDSLDRRHGAGRGGLVLLLARELAHLRDVARRTGYRIAPQPPVQHRRLPGDLAATVDALERAIRDEDLAPYLLLLETVFAGQDPSELAAAALALLRRKTPAAPRAAATVPASRPSPYVRLFISLGERDQVGAKDLVGAITGESGIDGAQIGKIEVRDTLSLVEVEEAVAEKVIRALNGTTIRGRSVRVDFDRTRRGPARPARGAGPRRK